MINREVALSAVLLGLFACSAANPAKPGSGGASSGGTTIGATGGSQSSDSGGAASGGLSVTGGVSTGGRTTGGNASGGSNPTGGVGTGGHATQSSNDAGKTGGALSGSTASAGALSGGKASGGSGGAPSSGGASGGKASGGTTLDSTSMQGGGGGGSTGGRASNSTASGGTTAALPSFLLGADISSLDESIDSGSTFIDTDGKTRSIFAILKNHGFNFVRLRAFVKPGAKYGYAQGTGGTCVKAETYCDLAHTVAFAKLAQAENLGILLDLHYSDTWADPGNQIIPEDWRNVTSITDLASRVQAYSKESVSAMVAAGVRPAIVQVGNETTPGMLMHVPNANTDCWGNNVSAAPIGGSASNWANLGALLKAGVAGVKAVDPTIKTMIHIENTDKTSAVVSYVKSARDQGVAMDIVGLSCYVAFQGQPSVWQNTFTTLASTFSDLSFVIAEYNPERTQANQIMQKLPNRRGLGTFLWEPTQSGSWGEAMFTWSGNTARAKTADFEEFDAIAASLGLK